MRVTRSSPSYTVIISPSLIYTLALHGLQVLQSIASSVPYETYTEFPPSRFILLGKGYLYIAHLNSLEAITWWIMYRPMQNLSSLICIFHSFSLPLRLRVVSSDCRLNFPYPITFLLCYVYIPAHCPCNQVWYQSNSQACSSKRDCHHGYRHLQPEKKIICLWKSSNRLHLHQQPVRKHTKLRIIILQRIWSSKKKHLTDFKCECCLNLESL